MYYEQLLLLTVLILQQFCAAYFFRKNYQKFDLKTNESNLFDVPLNSYERWLILSVHSTGPVQLFGSFCKSSLGRLIIRGEQISTTITPSELYWLRERTGCFSDPDPFYDKQDNFNKSFYITVTGDGQQIEVHGDLLVEIRSDRIRRDQPSFKDALSHRFHLRQGGDKTVRFDFEPDELYVNIGVTLEEGNSSVVGVFVSACQEMEDRFLGNATEESVFSGHVNSSDLNALKEEGKCNNDNANSNSTALLVRLHCWSEEASGELFFHSNRRSKESLRDNIRLKSLPQVIFNTSLSLHINEARTYGAVVPDISRGLEIRLSVTKGSFGVYGGFCMTNTVFLNSFGIGNWVERLDSRKANDLLLQTWCDSKGRSRRDARGAETSTFYVMLAGKSQLNSASVIMTNGDPGQLIPISKSSSGSWWRNLGTWLYVAYAVIAIFAIGTLIFMIVFLIRFLGRRSAVEDYNAISAFGQRRSKIEETTSRTWI